MSSKPNMSHHAAREWGWVVSNPVSGRTLPEPEGRVRWLNTREAQALIEAAAADPMTAAYLPDFIRLALHTGMRRGELLSLEWARVDFSANLIHLAGINTKSGKRRSIPLNAIARAALINRAGFRASRCPNAPWVFCNERGQRITSIKRSFNTACRRASLVDFHIHDLRHTCAAWLVSAGVQLAEVRDLLGHASIVMTERYAHLAPENIRAAVALLESASRFGHATNEDKKVRRGVTTNVSPQVPWMGSPFGRMRPPTRHRIRGGAVNPAAVKRMEQ